MAFLQRVFKRILHIFDDLQAKFQKLNARFQNNLYNIKLFFNKFGLKVNVSILNVHFPFLI